MFRAALISLCVAGAAVAETWTVDDDGKADFNNIQAAIDAASDGDEIVVMPGTYTSTQSGHVVNMLGKAVTLRSSDPSNPDVVAGTVIDGEQTRRGIACFNSETNKTVIDGFTITNGYSMEFDYDGNGQIGIHEEDGGGMYNRGSHPSITNCTFTNNFTDGGVGGGLINLFSSNPTLTNCTFRDNVSDWDGGGMGNDYSCDPILVNCTFANNTAKLRGGGMYNWSGSNPTLIGCRITSNTASASGGGGIWGNSAVSLTNSVVCGNSPDQISGAWKDNGGNWVDDPCPADTDGDGVPDDIDNCYLWNPDQADCNDNGVGDVCDIADGLYEDCDENGVPDVCDLADGTHTDCNDNGVGDVCDIADGTSTDCDENGIPDTCDLADGTHTDCNDDGIPDMCTLWSDINNDGVLDVCQAANGEHVYYGGLMVKHYYSPIGVYGHSVDLQGDTMVIGATYALPMWSIGGDGACVDIFELDENAEFTRVQRITHPEQEPNALTFSAVSVDPPFLAIGSHNQEVRIYQRHTTETGSIVCDVEWKQIDTILPGAESHSGFAHTISLQDGVLAIAEFAHVDGAREPMLQVYRSVVDGEPWEHMQQINLAEASDSLAGMPTSLVLDGDRLLVAWCAQINGSEGKADVLIFRRDSDGLFVLEQDLDFPWEYPDTLECGSVMADIDGDRLVVMSYMWGNYCFDSYEEGPSGIWTYRFDVDKGRWEFEEELIDDLWEWPSGWRSIGIDGDLVFAATFSYSPVQVYNGRAATVWRASDTGWDLVSRIQRPVSAYSATIAFPGMPLAASGNRCVLSNLSPERQDAILVTMDADGNGVLDIDQVLANPKIDADGTGIPDAAEYDCNENGIADALDIYMDPSLDNPSHSNGVIDACEPDLDGNGIPDWIDILEGTFVDFNENWIPDALEGDCNNNGIGDVIEIAMGLLDDFNGDWIPDECQCLADLSQNGVVDIADVLMLIATWGETCSLGDLNGDNTVEVQDLLYLIAAWGGCP